ncbi:hypothetical protein [Rhodanobacter umsongensis]
MIDNNVDKADGELRTMLAAMVNDPVIDAIRKSSDALTNRMSESMKDESSLILGQFKKIANSVSELPDDLRGLRSRMDQVLKDNDSLKTTGTDTKAELERSVAEIVSRMDINAQAVEALPARVRHVIAEDFADGQRRMDEAVATLRSVSEDAEKDRADNKAVWINASRGVRLQVAMWGTLSVLEAIGIAVLLYHSFGH